MNKFNTVIITLTAFFVGALIFIGCTKSTNTNITLSSYCDTANVVCYNGGVCVSGICQCPAGFEGVDCLKRWNERYNGTYSAQDDCNSGLYDINITAVVGSPSKISFDKIGTWCPGQGYVADIITNNTTLKFPMQRICNDIYFSGTGTQTIDGDLINLVVHARDSANHTSKMCSLRLSRK